MMSKRSAWIFASIALCAFVARFVFMLEARACPMFDGLVVDGASYGAWSDRIAAGDWIGTDVFYQAPLYPYFLAVVKLAVGHDLWNIRLVQIAIGSVACGVLFLAGERFFSRKAGIAAGLLLALYPSAIFFDATIQKTVLGGLWIALLLLVLALVHERATFGRWLAAGIVLGLSMLTREETILLVPAIALWGVFVPRSEASVVVTTRGKPCAVGTPRGEASAVVTAHRETRLVRARGMAGFLLGLAVVLVPVAARNAHVGGEFVLTTSQAGPNFYIGNGPHADGTYVPLVRGRGDTQFEREDAVKLAEAAEGRALTPSEVSSHWFRAAFAFITSEPGRYVALVARKVALLVNAFEVPDAEDLYFYERFSGLVRVAGCVWSFGVLVPLTAAGIALSWSRRRELSALFVVFGTLAIGVALFYVFARYRYSLVPVLVLFAGAALVDGFAITRAKRWNALAVPGAVFAVAWCASNLWQPWPRDQALPNSYQNSGLVLAQKGDLDGAMEMFREVTRLRPNAPESWGNLGQALLNARRFSEAADALTKEVALHPPDLAQAETRLGSALAQSGRLEEGLVHLDAAIAIEPQRLEALDVRATVRAKLGRWKDAAQDLRALVAVVPGERGPRGRLAMILAAAPDDATRNGLEALAIADQLCSETGSRDASALDLRAAALAELGRFDEAVAILRELVRANTATAAMRERLAAYGRRTPYRLAR